MTKPHTNMQQLLCTLQNRADMYRVLARLYQSELTESSLADLHAIRFPETSENEALNAAGRALNQAIASLEPSMLDELAADYARTFLSAGVADGPAAFPFESVYTSPEKLIMQDAYEAVLRILRRHGLLPSKPDLYADHIGIELEFMGFMSSKAVEAAQAGLEKALSENLDEEASFLKQHLLNWTNRFFDDQDKVAGTPLYQALGHFARAYLEEDRKWLLE